MDLHSAASAARQKAMEDLLGMGFLEHQCRKALREVSTVQAAVDYIMHNEDKPEDWWHVSTMQIIIREQDGKTYAKSRPRRRFWGSRWRSRTSRASRRTSSA
jgi:uncharacterized UBP type Zn finger protein